MDLVKEIGISEERAETGLRAEIDGATAVLSAGEVSRVCVVEDPPAESDEARMLLRRD